MEQTANGTSALGARPGLVATLALAMAMSPLLVQGLTAMSPLIVAELGLSRAQFGAFATTSFLVGTLGSSLAGGLVDRADPRRAMVVLHVAGGASVVVAALAQSYAWIIVGVVISGVVLAMANPLTNRLIVAFTRTAGRGTIMGIKQAGVQMAQAFAGLVLPVLALLLGWRGSLASAAVLAMVGLLLTARYIPAATATDGALHPPRRQGRAPLPPIVWWLTGYAVLSGFALQAGNVYLPLYGYEALGLASATAGALTAVVGVVGLASRIFWGGVMERAAAPRFVLLGLAGGGALGVALIALAEVVHPALVWVGAGLFGATGLAANVVLMVVVLQVVPTESVGRATGVLSMGLFAGFTAGPVTIGVLVDATGSYRVGWGLALGAFAVCGILALIRRDWSTAD